MNKIFMRILALFPWVKMLQWLLAETGWQRDVAEWLAAENEWYFKVAAQVWGRISYANTDDLKQILDGITQQ